MKMGLCEGPPASIQPDLMGRADYTGVVVNMAARWGGGGQGGQGGGPDLMGCADYTGVVVNMAARYGGGGWGDLMYISIIIIIR